MADPPRILAATTRPIEVLARPFLRFAKVEASSGLLLLAGTIAALIWANSSWVQSYDSMWSAQVSIALGRFALTETRHEWINDGLMAVFFLLVGLEIKREVLIGELSSLRQAAFPLIAAIGGAVLPAFLYLLIAHGVDAQKGWAIPMATDIAFALGVLAILGSRVPVSLKIFVTALAIVDDLIAVLVIAIFYTDRIQLVSLGLGLAGVALCIGANLLGVRKLAVYGIIGVFVWYAVLNSGIHATIAGVLLALTIPARTQVERDSFLKRSRRLIDRFEGEPPGSFEARSTIHALEREVESVESPLHRMEHLLHPWVSFAIMPLFAFANAGVRIWGNLGAAVKHPVSVGVAVGLFVGKPLGIWVSARMAGESRLASPPPELSWRALFGAAWLSGIGFTMSLFIATLAFGEGVLLDMAKIGILAASVTSGACGSVFLIRCSGSAASQSGPGPETAIERM
ncbi:MAG TPA: Na+/H+ antiporter NhaA [Deltaproteobacteria bacterium]|jgi:NhaA family Na+:H+ antiporter|nr:Na+/H+ antiporter NhaA [Deltaproteobacteria bacterium]